MVNLFEIQVRVATELGVEPTQIRSWWITEVLEELGMPFPSIWNSAGSNRGPARCPPRCKAAIIAVVQSVDWE